jgi:hypothetical protein
MPDLETSILEELKRTGFPTEIMSATVMQGRGWLVMHNPSYFDVDESKSREFDIRAYRQKSEAVRDQNYVVSIYLVTEYKKSDKPWVFFTTPEKYITGGLGEVIKWDQGEKQVFSDRNNPKGIIIDGHLRGFHHYFQHPRLARTFHQPFTRSEKEHSQMIYSAVMSVIKATLFLTGGPPRRSPTWLRIFYPLVVFSGNLFEAHVQPNKEIKLLKSKHVQLSFNYITDTNLAHQFMIDIIHEDYLDEFLKIVEHEHEEISSVFFSSLH